MKTLLKVVVGLCLSALTLYLFIRPLDLEKVRLGLGGANLPLLLAAILVGYFGHLTARSFRWATMLQPIKTQAMPGSRLSFYNLFSTTAIGYLITWLVPLRLGEIARPMLLGRREGISSASAIATVGLERVLDAATVLFLAAIAALSAPLWSPLSAESFLRGARWFGALGLAGCIAGLWMMRALVHEESWFLKFLTRRRIEGTGPLRHLWTVAGHLVEGASFLRDGPRSLRVAGLSLLVWGTIGVSTWIGLLAAGVHIPFVGVFLLLALSVIGIAVPTPGGTGTVHFAFQQGLIRIFGVEPNLASVATVLYHPIIVYIPPVLFGLLFAWRDGLSLGSLRRLARSEPGSGSSSRGGGAGASAPRKIGAGDLGKGENEARPTGPAGSGGDIAGQAARAPDGAERALGSPARAPDPGFAPGAMGRAAHARRGLP